MSSALSVPTSNRVMVPLAGIVVDEDGPLPVRIRDGVVREYAAAMRQQRAEGSWRFPDVVLFSNDSSEYWVGDGRHRIMAARKAGLNEIAAEVRTGSERDALLFGISANSAHGLRWTNADTQVDGE